MKKLLSLLLAFVLVLMLTACNGGGETTNSGGSQSQENYSSDKTNGDGESQSQQNYKAVKITLDNWQDYFEISEFPVWKEDAFGETDGFNLEYEFRLKKEFYPRLNAKDSSIAMEISYSYGEKPCKVNFEKKTYELGEPLRTETTTNITEKFYDYDGKFYTSPFGVTFYDTGKQEVRYYDNVEMIRIKGTLYLAAE